MNRFQQLLFEESRNQYGWQFKHFKGSKPFKKVSQVNNQNKKVQGSQTVEIYLKTDEKRSLKINLGKRSKIQNIKLTIQEKLSIPYNEQIIYLNGKQVSLFSYIILNQKQILHISNKKNVIELNEQITVDIKVSLPENTISYNKTVPTKFKGSQKVQKLRKLVQQTLIHQLPLKDYQFNFLESGRILIKTQSFNENRLSKNCEILCLVSQNQVQTKSMNQCEGIIQEKRFIYQRIGSSSQYFPKKYESENQKSQLSQNPLIVSKKSVNSNTFQIRNKTQNSSNIRKNEQTYHPNDQKRTNMKHKSELIVYSPLLSPQQSGFKKKKSFTAEVQSEDSRLIKKITVHKTKQQLQILLQNSVLREDVDEDIGQNISVVSSSSSEQKQYVSIRQQKQYRPCPLIPQKKMPQSQKMKISMQLQRLFGQQPKNSPVSNYTRIEQQGKMYSPVQQRQEEMTNFKAVLRNNTVNVMRNSLGSKESMLRMIKDKKPNRYAEENLEADQ